MEQRTKKFSSGQLIIELLLAFGLASILLPAVILGFVTGSSGKAQLELRLRALGYMREAEEAVRSVRDLNWNNIAVNGTYHPIPGATWSLQSGSEIIDTDFTRSIVISDVSPADPSKKQITVTVFWNNILPTNLTSTLILSRWKNQNSTVSTTGQLAGLGFGDWCNPAGIPSAQISLTGGLNVISVAQGSGDVISFVGSGNSANGLTYADIDITDPIYPAAPVPTVLGSVSNAPQIKTNGAFNDVNYGYLAADQHGRSGQGLIVDLSKIVTDPTHSIIGSLDTGSSTSGKSIYVLGNTAFLTTSDGYLYAFDITIRNGSHSPISGSAIQLAGIGVKIIVVGSNAYIATASITNQLQIINVSNPGSPSIVANISVGNSQSAMDVFVDPVRLRAYLVTSYASSSQPDFFTIDVNPTDAWYKQIIATYITSNSMNPTGVVYVTGNRAVVVGKGSTRNYQVIDVTNEGVPPPVLSICGAGGINTTYDINAITTLFTKASRAYSYIITTDSGKEYKIIEGGAGGGGGGNGGIFESPIFNAGHLVVFNNFKTLSTNPAGIFVNYQVAVSSNCTTFNYTGNYGYAGGTIPVSLNPGQCFRYKVSFSNGGGAGSATTNVSVNYSP